MSFDFDKDPFSNFQSSLGHAQVRGIPEYNAMTLATATIENGDAKPSCRIVYYKGLVRGGFSFYTNYNGQKGQDILSHPNVCVNFYWPNLNEQIRISGVADKLTEGESDQYFWSRPRLSQIGAWASQQSSELKSFDEFHKSVSVVESQYRGMKVPRPPYWGGFRIVPNEIEFWFGRSGRLHERYVYTRVDNLGLNVTLPAQFAWKRKLKFP